MGRKLHHQTASDDALRTESVAFPFKVVCPYDMWNLLQSAQYLSLEPL